MNGVNALIATVLTYLPKWFARPFASPYVAGENFKSARDVVRNLNTNGFKATLDILGEHVTTPKASHDVRDAYIQLLNDIKAENLDSGISLKLTHLGVALDPALAESNLLFISETAKKLDLFLRIDMEDSTHTDSTLDLYKKCAAENSNVGTVLQAYLRRTMDDIRSLGSSKFNVRICKGIYREPEAIAFHDPDEIRDNYLAAVKAAVKSDSYVGIATHDLGLITRVENWLRAEDVPTDRFEFQVLFGVPMQGKLEYLRDQGYTVRSYVPYGEAWFDYSIRRLKENPHIVGYVLKNLFTSKT